MSVVTIFSGIFCEQETVIDDLVTGIGYQQLSQDEIVAQASDIAEMPESKIMRAFTAKTSVFNKFTQDKERAIAYLKLALAQKLTEDNIIIAGCAGHLIPKSVSHVLRVCLIGDLKYRYKIAMSQHQLSEKEVLKQIRKSDSDCSAWTDTLYDVGDPWSDSIYDLVLPMDKLGAASASSAIEENLLKDILRPTLESKQAVKDFLLASLAGVELTKQGHDVQVSAKDGVVTLVTNKKVLRQSRLDDELKSIVEPLTSVKSVKTEVGKDFHQSDIYRKTDFKMPSKVLLVDDEREFVQTLSERLIMRDMGSAVVYDGEAALNIVQDDEPEVIVIDLKMPNIDGFEVLEKVKATHPEIEVIVLTGHGSEDDRLTCMELGAFAYMQKPVDIEELSFVLKEAQDKIRQDKKLLITKHDQ